MAGAAGTGTTTVAPQAAAPTPESGFDLWWLAIAGGLVLVGLLVTLVRLRPETPGFAQRAGAAAPVAWLRRRSDSEPEAAAPGPPMRVAPSGPPPPPKPVSVDAPKAQLGERIAARLSRPQAPKVKGPSLGQRLAQSRLGRAIAERFTGPKIKGPSLRQRMLNSAFARRMSQTDVADSMRARKAAKQLRATIEERQQELSRHRPPTPKEHHP
jgi:hypothetical protein